MPLDQYHAFASGRAFSKPNWLYENLSQVFKLFTNLSSKLAAIQAWRQFSRCAEISNELLLGSKAWCINARLESDRIQLRGRVICRGLLRIEDFGNGKITVQPEVYIGDDCLISCANSIEIGSYTLIAHGVQIFDNDSHPLDWNLRQQDWQMIMAGQAQNRPAIATAPIRIGQHVWLGFNSIILKGVTIGDRSIIAAGSVVTSDIPSDVVAGGNPAKVIKIMTEGEE